MTDEASVLQAAKAGNEGAFKALIAPHQKGLRAHCYRMTGSLHDAEDVLQDSLIKAWRGLSGFEARSSLRSWLYSVATRSCLDALDKRKTRSLPVWDGPPQSPSAELAPSQEPVWLEPCPDEATERRESIGLAFLAALQTLPPRQRAALILREVLEFSSAECAQMLELTEAAVNSALQRARATVEQRSTHAPVVENDSTRKVLAQYLEAWERADVTKLVSLLTHEATLSMPPFPGWFLGARDIAATLSAMVLTGEARGQFKLVPMRANGLPGFAAYKRDGGTWVAMGLQLLEPSADGTKLKSITAFLDPSLFPLMELPSSLPEEAHA